MSEALLLWLFGGAFGGIVTLSLLFLKHIQECRGTRAMLAELKTNQETILREIGTHETGLRGSVHKLRSDISPFVVWAQHKMERE